MPLLTARQFEEWRAYYRNEPWGYYAEDDQHTFTRHTIAQSHGVKKQGGGKLKQKDFSLAEERKKAEKEYRKARRKSRNPKVQSVEEMKEQLLRIFHNSKKSKPSSMKRTR